MSTTKDIRRTYNLIVSLFWLATALPMALLVLLIQTRGIDLFQVGVLMGAYSATIVLLEVPTGGLADAIGRKRTAVLAYSFTAAAGVVYLFAFSFAAFLVGFILNGVGRALASGALDAWFIDALQTADPEVEIQPALAQAGTFTLLALGAGTLLGGFMPRLFGGLPAEGTAVLTPFATPIVLAIVVKIVMLALAVLLVKEERPPDDTGSWKKGFRQLPVIIGDAFTLSRRNPTIVLLLGATLASGLAVISLESFWQPHFARLLGGGQGNSLFFGAVMAGNFMAGMLGNVAVTPLSRLLKRRYGLVAALFQGIRGALLILLAMQTAVAAAVVLFWLVYLNMGVVNSPHATLINQEIPAQRRSSMLSVQSLATYIGSILGSTGLGYIAERASVSLAWTVAGGVLVVSLVLYWLVDRRQIRQKRHDEQKIAILETG